MDVAGVVAVSASRVNKDGKALETANGREWKRLRSGLIRVH
jgi:hypothetical protein